MIDIMHKMLNNKEKIKDLKESPIVKRTFSTFKFRGENKKNRFTNITTNTFKNIQITIKKQKIL